MIVTTLSRSNIYGYDFLSVSRQNLVRFFIWPSISFVPETS